MKKKSKNHYETPGTPQEVIDAALAFTEKFGKIRKLSENHQILLLDIIEDVLKFEQLLRNQNE